MDYPEQAREVDPTTEDDSMEEEDNQSDIYTTTSDGVRSAEDKGKYWRLSKVLQDKVWRKG